MFFNLETGEVSDTTNSKCCWRADNLIFFDIGALISFHIEDIDLELLCDMLDQTKHNKDYVDMEGTISRPLIAIEDEDEGTRNFCVFGDNVHFILNLSTIRLMELGVFLRTQLV